MNDIHLTTLANKYRCRNVIDPVGAARIALESRPSCLSEREHYESLLKQADLIVDHGPPDETP